MIDNETIGTLQSLFPRLTEKQILDNIERGLQESLDDMEKRIIAAIDSKLRSLVPSGVSLETGQSNTAFDLSAEFQSFLQKGLK